ncbi:GtrA family protein [Actinomadura craniellae]|uniref:GtrA family protein n=1 Tax=Actinomadura craniellae TaxID=2231787 RepID=UPI001F2578F6|nr:GtrA family protein [Actinomadura craniellae]
MSTLPRAATGSSVSFFLRELATFGFVGGIGTLISFLGANLLRTSFDAGPVLATLLSNVISTSVSYLANRHLTFRHRDSAGSGREVAVFFGLNGVGMAIQVCCTAFTHYTLGLEGALAYNLALLAGLGLGAGFRYWSYKKWVFTPPVPERAEPRTASDPGLLVVSGQSG